MLKMLEFRSMFKMLHTKRSLKFPHFKPTGSKVLVAKISKLVEDEARYKSLKPAGSARKKTSLNKNENHLVQTSVGPSDHRKLIRKNVRRVEWLLLQKPPTQPFLVWEYQILYVLVLLHHHCY